MNEIESAQCCSMTLLYNYCALIDVLPLTNILCYEKCLKIYEFQLFNYVQCQFYPRLLLIWCWNNPILIDEYFFYVSFYFRYNLGLFEPATFQKEGIKRHLLLHGYRFYQNGVSSKTTTSWLCVSYYRNRCRARATTCFINGIEMARLNSQHSHPPYDTPKRYFTN